MGQRRRFHGHIRNDRSNISRQVSYRRPRIRRCDYLWHNLKGVRAESRRNALNNSVITAADSSSPYAIGRREPGWTSSPEAYTDDYVTGDNASNDQ
ncbi:hypothetical protein EVAR_17665_1 [Eumeta japonica]|uniref:Uncharacterized protein n=1 Tax=Eumeta variegata TaxID=151549 RepID=A0A4C1URP7_EUMVA|nr:hypothetical protein EVAR_17665_1 [Eumeta japonica]